MFSSSTYDIKKDSSVSLRFEVSENFVADGVVAFRIENEKIAKIESFEYDSSTNSYNVVVTGLKKGNTRLFISSSGHREGDSTNTDFIESTSIVVKYNGISSWILTLLYVMLACYAVVFVIFVLISFVNARRNIVK